MGLAPARDRLGPRRIEGEIVTRVNFFEVRAVSASLSTIGRS